MNPTKADEQFASEALSRLTSAEEALRLNEIENARLKRLVQALRDLVAMMNHQPSPTTEGLSLGLPPSQPQKPIAAMSIREAAITLLKRQGAMTNRELLDAMVMAGRRVGGKQPGITVRSILREKPDTFQRTEDKKWTLVENTTA